MVCKLCWNLLNVRLDSNAWECSSRHPEPLVVLNLARVLIRKGAPCWKHHGWQIEAFFSLLQCIFKQMPMEMCSDMDCRAGIAQGAVQESPGLRLTQCTRKDIPVSWPNHCVSCLLGSGYGFFSAPKPTVFEKGTLSSLFIFKSVLTVWLTKEGCFKVCAENPNCCSLCYAERGWGEGKTHKSMSSEQI